MSRSCLVSLFGPGNVLAALSAVKWYGVQRHGEDEPQVVTLLHNPGLSGDAVQESAQVVERVLTGQGWAKPLVLTMAEMAELVRAGERTTYRQILDRFRKRIGVGRFDEVYYAHDVVGRAAELAMNAYPKAERITFGDALGSVYDKQYHLALAQGRSAEQDRPTKTWQVLRSALRPREVFAKGQTILKHRLLGKPQPFQADKAVLILPMDQTGDCLENKELFVVPKKVVLEIISACQRSLSDLAEYSRKVLNDTSAPHFLILLENWSEGHFISFENEVEMYEEIVHRYVPPGATVLLKAHPFSVAPLDEVLSDRLSSSYRTLAIAGKYRRYPMELWGDFVAVCHIITLSYCSVSLSYLYDKQMIYPMDESLIERYLPQPLWESYKNADSLCRGQLTSLASWDGQSVLWKGSW